MRVRAGEPFKTKSIDHMYVFLSVLKIKGVEMRNVCLTLENDDIVTL